MISRFRILSAGVHATVVGLLCLASLGMADPPPIPAPTHCPAPPRPRVYRAEGALGPVSITDSGLPLSGIPQARLADGHPVRFWLPQAHADMFSSPVIELVVAQPATFVIDVHEVGGVLIDSFRYADVDSGAYVFPIAQQLWRGPDETVLVLRCNGATVDSVVYADTIAH